MRKVRRSWLGFVGGNRRASLSGSCKQRQAQRLGDAARHLDHQRNPPMKRQLHAFLALWTSLAIAVTGCAPTQPFFFFEDGDLSHYVGMATAIEHPDVETCSLAEVEHAGQPITVTDPELPRNLGAFAARCRAIHAGKQQGNALARRAAGQLRRAATAAGRKSGNRVAGAAANADRLRSGDHRVRSELWRRRGVVGVRRAVGKPAVLGEERSAAERGTQVGDFDPNRHWRSIESAGRTWASSNASLSKRSRTGGRFAVAANSIYEFSNSGSRELPSDWNQNFEVQASQPLLQGAGVFFNRIAGPFDPFQRRGHAEL